MPKSDNQKLKIFYLLDYLQRYSHAGHPVTATELADMLKQRHDINCERKTIYSDIAALQEYGVDIVAAPGKKGGYYIASRNFELSELKLLIDAVQSSRFLTEKKTRELIGKLCSQCNEHDASLMRREVLVSGRVKSMNESIYYNVDAIQEAIAQNRQISFRYFDWDINGQRRYRDREYIASPYGLCQDNENYYLLAHSPRHGVTSYRVDRMEKIRLTEDSRIPCPELAGEGLTRYASRMFQMFSGEPTTVKFRFHRELANAVMDRFGRDTMLIPDGEDHFVFTAQVAVSPLFFGWLLGFGTKARILYPQWVIDQCTDLCQTILKQYQTSEKE